MAAIATEEPAPQPQSTLISTTVRLDAEIPARKRWCDYRRREDGSIEVITHILVLRGEWPTLPEAQDVAWKAVEAGPYVVAYRIEG